MYIFLLLVFLFLVCVLGYVFWGKYILHPSVMVPMLFGFSTLIAFLNLSTWGDIHQISLFVIIGGVITFCVGCFIGDVLFISLRNFFNRNKKSKQTIFTDQYFTYNIPQIKTIWVILFMFVVTVLDYIDLSNLTGGGLRSLLEITTAARFAYYSGDVVLRHNFLVHHALSMCKMICYIYLFFVGYRLFVSKKKIKLIYLVPIILYYIQALFTTGRTDFIYIIYATLIIWYGLFKSTQAWVPFTDYKFIKYAGIGVGLFILLFLMITLSRYGDSRNTNYDKDITTSLSVYAGSSIYALDSYITTYGLSQIKSIYWGEETQYLYYDIQRLLGVSSKKIIDGLPPTFIGKSSQITTVYTALRRYIHDFGLIKMYVILFCLGFIYSIFFTYIRIEKDNFLMLLIYAFLSYPLVELAIEERFFTTLLCWRTLYCLFYLIIFYKILIVKRAETRGKII